MRHPIPIVFLAFGAPGLGCSLLIDTDAIRASRDAGAQGRSDHAGAQGLDAGGRGDIGLAGLDAEPAEGTDRVASPCGRPEAQGLRCAAPVRLDGRGGDLGPGAVAGLDHGFVVTLVEGDAVVTRVLDLDARALRTDRALVPSRPSSLQVASSGEQWAVAFVNQGGRQIRCLSSLGAARSSTITPPHPVQEVAVAVGPGGGVALGAVLPDDFSTRLFRAVPEATGCPARGDETQPAYYVHGVAAMAVPGVSPDAFRFGVTAVEADLLNTVVAEVEAVGLRVESAAFSGLGVWGIEITPTSDGQFLLAAVGKYDDTETRYGLWALSQRVDFQGHEAARRQVAPDVTGFDFDGCGPGCRVLGYRVDEGRARLTATFLSDDGRLEPLGASSEYDVGCSSNAASTGVALAYSAGKVAFLTFSASEANLIVCSVPPL